MTPRFPFRASRDDASAGDPVGPLTRRRLVGAGALGLFGAVVLLQMTVALAKDLIWVAVLVVTVIGLLSGIRWWWRRRTGWY